VQPAVGRERVDHRAPVELHVDSADQHIEAASEFFDRVGVFARHDVTRAETSRFIELALARRKRGHVAAVGGGEFDGHMTEPADADDADAIGRLGVHH